ncbi:hypothetical protein MAR_020039 [Mya arenaria]|uniref:Uncharacterized protein n=1 Tax=Mya arenaria TaxID=6604 RepID=A0ABY7E3V7_MYAAR|nr:hypothetical protein MAR_020039 [Mya arenaria]
MDDDDENETEIPEDDDEEVALEKVGGVETEEVMGAAGIEVDAIHIEISKGETTSRIKIVEVAVYAAVAADAKKFETLVNITTNHI